MNSNSGQCILPYCDMERYEERQQCILHIDDAAKDSGLFNRTLNRLIESKGFMFHGIYFPGDFTFPSTPDSRVRLLHCRFAGGFEVRKMVFPDQVSIEYTVFEGPVLFSECHFETDVFFINNQFHNLFSLYGSGFHGNTYLGFNTFRQGVNLYRIGFKADSRFLFRHCEMGCSFFHNADIQHMEFVLCRWHKFYRLAEEQYHLKIPVKFGDLGVPDTYMNRLLLWVQRRLAFTNFPARL
ncbi:MAG TPA: pentapeptide repeat-containing protein, partial [bacterium]|nr:pentapeptide repeat-containing protein [bacterium]